MAHVNLLYPFVPANDVDKVVPLLVEACASVTPFTVTLASFHLFRHSSGTATLWLAPEPVDRFACLQRVLQERFPEYDDLARIGAGYTPHLSLEQARSADACSRLRDELQACWRPLQFELTAVAVIRAGRTEVSRSSNVWTSVRIKWKINSLLPSLARQRHEPCVRQTRNTPGDTLGPRSMIVKGKSSAS